MTDLADRLAAIGVTLPEVEAYEEHVGERQHWMLQADMVFREKAEPALAAVVGELERAVAEAKELAMTLISVKLPPDAAQVAVQRLRAERAEAENARLRVCGTCEEHEGNYGDECCRSWLGPPVPYYAYRVPESVNPTDPCHFTPSRWTPYWGET